MKIVMLLLLPALLLSSCGIDRNIHFREGKTTLIQQPLPSFKSDTLVVFEPVAGFRTSQGYDVARLFQAERNYRVVLNGQLDHYLTAASQPHLMIRGNFLKTADLKNAVFMLGQVNFSGYSFDSLPLPKSFVLPAGKPALIIYHELGFRSEWSVPDIDLAMQTEGRFLNVLFDNVVDIRSYALLVKNRELVYYRSNRVEFDKLKWLRRHYKTQKVYKRILNDLFKGNE